MSRLFATVAAAATVAVTFALAAGPRLWS